MMKLNIWNKSQVYTVSQDISKRNEDKSKGTINAADDYVTQCMGSFGPWQIKYSVIAGCTRLIAMWNFISVIFLVPSSDFKCSVFDGNIPDEVEESRCYNNCVKYEYNNTVFKRTLVSDFDLICDKAWLASFTQTMLMFGVLIGTNFFGWICDRFGRRVGLRMSMIINVILMTASSFATSYSIFTGIRFLIGLATGGLLICTSLYFLEIVGTSHREKAGCYAILPDGISQALLAVFAYYSSTWNGYLFKYAMASVVIFVLTLLLPETPRWLVSNGKVDEAVELMTEAAKCNNKETDKIREIVMKTIESAKSNSESENRSSPLNLIKVRSLALRTLGMFFVFMAAGFLYFGINQFVPNIGTNVYIDVALLGLIQLPPSLFSIVLNNILGRKTCLILTYVVTGASIGCLAVIPKGHWAVTLFGLIGMSFISISFAVIYIYVSELFPTPLRMMALGIIASGAKIGSMSSPFIATLTPQWIPSVIFGVIPVLASLVCLLLPETKGQDLKDNVI